MAERLNAPVLKTDVGESPPWVRIPPPPPLALEESFSRPGCGRIFPLFSRVMRVGLLTGGGARRPESVLSEPIFSKADDCADLVLSFKTLNMNGYFQKSFWSVFENIRLADRTGVGIALSKTDFPTFTPVERDPVWLYDTYRPMRISLQPCVCAGEYSK